MDTYRRNRFCPCVRCRTNCMMGPAILVTLGVMFLLDNYHITRGASLVAVLLIVIGAVKLLQSSASTEGHQQPGYPYPPAAPPSAGGTTSSGSSSEVHNG